MSHHSVERYKVSIEHFIHIGTIMYRIFTLLILDIVNPSLRTNYVTPT